MEAIQVYKKQFDSLENRNPEYEELLGTFVAEGDLTAHGKAAKFINDMPPFSHYLGYDGKTYPYIFIKRITIS